MDNGALDLPRLCALLVCLSYTPLVAKPTRTSILLPARRLSRGVEWQKLRRAG